MTAPKTVAEALAAFEEAERKVFGQYRPETYPVTGDAPTWWSGGHKTWAENVADQERARAPIAEAFRARDAALADVIAAAKREAFEEALYAVCGVQARAHYAARRADGFEYQEAIRALAAKVTP